MIYVSKNEAVYCEVQTHSEVIVLQGVWKTSGRNFTIYASKTKLFACEVETQFGVLRLQGVQKEVLGAFSRFVCHANRHSWLQNFVKMLWARFTILHTHTFLLCCWDTLWSSWLSHFIRMLLSLNTFKLQVHPQIVTGRCVFVRSTFKEVLDWHLRHVL